MTLDDHVTITIGEITPEIIELRATVLRAGLDPSTAQFQGDSAPGARHAVARLDKKIVGVGSMLPEEFGGRPGLRIRGMAVAAAYRSNGIGSAILAGLLDSAAIDKAGDGAFVWCHARLKARSLYERFGFVVVGEQFEVEGIGPHLRMVREAV